MNHKNQNVLQIIAIPFSAAPVNMLLLIISRIFLGIHPGLQIYALSRFIDQAVWSAGQGAISGNGSAVSMAGGLLASFVLFAAVYLSKPFVSAYSRLAEARIRRKLEIQLNSMFLQKAERLKYEHIENEETYDNITLLGEKLEGEFYKRTQGILLSAQTVLNYISLTLSLAAIKPWLAAVIFVFLFPLMCVGYFSGKKEYEVKKQVAEAERKADYLNELLMSREAAGERFLFQYGNTLSERWHREYRDYNVQKNHVRFLNMWNIEKTGLVVNLIFSGMVAVILYSVIIGEATIGILAALISQAISFTGGMRGGIVEIFRSYVDNKMYLSDWNRFMSMTEQPQSIGQPEEEMAENDRDAGKDGEIQFRNVTFHYPGSDKIILNHINLTIEAGKTYSIVGENGSGKTTLIKLLTGMYDNYEGSIQINGKNIGTYADTRSLFSIAYQDFVIYPLSIRENIQAGAVESSGSVQKDCDEDKLNALFRELRLTGLIEGLEDGADTKIGKMDAAFKELSGGESQKIAIARCLYSTAPILILDEPTAAIDPVYESELYGIFSRVGKGRTKIMISHRLGAAKLSDRIFVVSGGMIAEEGTHGELMERDGIYADMYRKQRGWYE